MNGKEMLAHEWWYPLTEEEREGGYATVDAGLVSSRVATAIFDLMGWRFEGSKETEWAGSVLYQVVVAGAIEHAITRRVPAGGPARVSKKKPAGPPFYVVRKVDAVLAKWEIQGRRWTPLEWRYVLIKAFRELVKEAPPA